MTISVFSVPYNSSTFDVGVIERWIVIKGGKLCHFRSSTVGKATSRSGVTYHSKSDQHSQVCYPPLSCRMRFFISRRFLSFSRGFATRGFGLRPKICRPSANTENSRRTREKPLVPRVQKSWIYACKLFMFLSVF